MIVNRHQISKLRNSSELLPSKQWVRQSKHQLLAEIGIRQQTRNDARIDTADQFRLFALRSVRKFIPSRIQVVSVLAIMVLIISTGVIAQAAVPGDALWPVKITIEKAEIALAVGSVQESKAHIRHTDNRLKELSIVISDVRAGTRKSQNISEVVRQLEKDITAANQSLKITNTENNSPEVVVSLAKDVNDKAAEVVKVLQDNQAMIASLPQGTDDQTGATQSNNASATSTTSEDNESSSNTENTSTPDSTEKSNDNNSALPVTKIVNEVQSVNENITYSTLQTMISVLEQGRASNRYEVTAVERAKVAQQQTRLVPIEKLIARISSNFLLHRSEARRLHDNGKQQLDLAAALVSLDNLSGSYRALISGRDFLDAADRIIEEVKLNKGLEAEKVVPVAPVSAAPILKEKKIVPKLPVTVQTVEIQLLEQPTSSAEQE